ncbi:hypothetical protein EAG_14237 [Camponotus floridanus]|uniref:Uncharacterized protein n=1 Tax=Camponotus floridanus TaxID=104421 RepID=E2A4T1_CAMFO|nr:hypothetical protein EAG_14237 [Camponotus floridanus]
MNKSVDNIFLSTNAVKAHSRTHNARHSSAEKSEGIIAPMVPHKGRICTSPLRQDRREITPFKPKPKPHPKRGDERLALQHHVYFLKASKSDTDACKGYNYAENLGKHLPLWRNTNLSDITWSLIDYNSGRRDRGGGEQWEIDVIVSGIVRRNEPRGPDFCDVFRSKCSKVLSDIPLASLLLKWKRRNLVSTVSESSKKALYDSKLLSSQRANRIKI